MMRCPQAANENPAGVRFCNARESRCGNTKLRDHLSHSYWHAPARTWEKQERVRHEEVPSKVTR